MLNWLTRLATQHYRRVLIGALILVPVLVLVGGGVEEKLSVGGFIVGNSESAVGDEVLEEVFDAGPADWVLVVSLRKGTVFNDAIRAAGVALTAWVGQRRSMMVTLAWPPPSHIVCRP